MMLLLRNAAMVILALLASSSVSVFPQEQWYVPPLEPYAYDPQFRAIAIRQNQPIGISVVAFNRPEYLARCIAALEKNPESAYLPIYFFLDGGPQAQHESNKGIIDASTIKNKTIIFRERNYGCPKNHIDAKRFMFDWCGFDKIIEIEEDLVISPSFIHLNLKLHAWARKKFSNVGIVQTWSQCYLTKKEKIKNLDVVQDSSDTWWSFVGYCLDKEVWNTMRPILYEYESFVDQIPHTQEFAKARSKPGLSSMAPQICSWMRTLLDKNTPMIQAPKKRLFPTAFDAKIRSWMALETFSSSSIGLTFAKEHFWYNNFTHLKNSNLKKGIFDGNNKHSRNATDL